MSNAQNPEVPPSPDPQSLDPDSPAARASTMPVAELRAQMGDADGNGIVSGEELLAALENNDRGQAIDEFFADVFGPHMVMYAARRQQMEPEEQRRFDEVARAALQIDLTNSISSARTAPTDQPMMYALRAVERIEIPADLPRLVHAVVGDVVAVDVPAQPKPTPAVDSRTIAAATSTLLSRS